MKSVFSHFEVVPKFPLDDGLVGGIMRNLPPIVALAGANGSGKTRILNRIRLAANQLPDQDHEAYVSRLNERQRNGAVVDKELMWATSVHWTFSAKPRIVDVPPENVQVQPFENAKQNQLANCDQSLLHGIQFSQVGGNTARMLHKIANDFLSATHPQSSQPADLREKTTNRFRQLQTFIRRLLRTEFEPYGFNDARLFGRKINFAEYSKGQTRLLQFVLAFFESGELTDPQIITIDEIELHLHPQATLDIINVVSDFAPNTQIWLTSHSVAVLASLPPTSIWYVNDGKVSYAGANVETVLNSLLGGEENHANLVSFIQSPANVARDRFVRECLQPPPVLDTSSDDPQQNQISAVIQELEHKPLVILDWGAGTGRLARTLADVKDSDSTASVLRYIAYDASDSDRDQCLANMKGLRADPSAAYFNELPRLTADMDSRRASVVVLSNVLHEIDPREWVELFTRQISNVVSQDGYVLIVEDLQLPHGEMANRYGFLLLDENGIRRLFDDTAKKEIVVTWHTEVRYSERLVAYLVPSSSLSKVSPASLKTTCQWLHDQAKREIDQIRQSPKGDHRTGRRLGLYFNQFANASLAMDSLG